MANCANTTISRYYRPWGRELYNDRMLKKPNGDARAFGESGGPIELLTIREVAELLKVSLSSVRRLQQGRHLPFIKVGGSVRFAKSDIVEYLQNGRTEAIH